MTSSLMDWTPTNAVLLQDTPSRGTKRTFDDFKQERPYPHPFNSYAGPYMPGGWPASPGLDRRKDRNEATPRSGVPDATSSLDHEDRIVVIEPVKREIVESSKAYNIIFEAVRRFARGITSQFSNRSTKQVHRTTATPMPKTPSGNSSTSNGTAISNQPSPIQQNSPESSTFSTFLSSNVPQTPDLSDVDEELDIGHLHHANEEVTTQLAPVRDVTPPNSAGEDFDNSYLHCAHPKLLRKLGLTQSPTPPESPKHAPTNEASHRITGEVSHAAPTTHVTPPASPGDDSGFSKFWRSAADIILMSPYPKLVPSLSLRPPFKFGRTPVPEPHNVYLPASTPEQPFRVAFKSPASTASSTTLSRTSGVRITPSAQLLAEAAREHSPVVEVSTPDPYHAKSLLSPPMSGELSAEQQKRYATRARAKQLEEAGKKLQGYNIEPLSKEWEAQVAYALQHGHGSYTTHDLIKVVPPSGSKTTSQWLNDETINGYLKLVTDLGNKGQTSGTIPKCHAFTSFFMTTLLEKGYEGVKRWSKRAKIDGKKLLDVQDVFIPINRSLHWTVLVVSPKQKVIRYYDSLGGNGRIFVTATLEWLRGELGAAFNVGDWQIDNTAASPMQNNGSDCGVFAITTAKQLMLGRSALGYGPDDIPIQRRRIVAELIAGKLL